MPEKQCTLCHVVKPLSEFRKDSRIKSGVGSRCKPCSVAIARNWAINNPEKFKETNKKWRQKNKNYDSLRKITWAKLNPEQKKAIDKRYYEANKRQILEKSIIYRETHGDRIREKRQFYVKKNLHKILAANKRRELSKLNRTPAWLSIHDLQKIESVYKQAKEKERETGIKYHVDHIIPLNGKLVSGLHVPNNLQIISAKENCRKRNSYTP